MDVPIMIERFSITTANNIEWRWVEEQRVITARRRLLLTGVNDWRSRHSNSLIVPGAHDTCTVAVTCTFSDQMFAPKHLRDILGKYCTFSECIRHWTLKKWIKIVMISSYMNNICNVLHRQQAHSSLDVMIDCESNIELQWVIQYGIWRRYYK